MAFGWNKSTLSYAMFYAKATFYLLVFLFAQNGFIVQLCRPQAHVAKLVDALSSGGSAFGCEGSNPFVRTQHQK